MSASRSSSVRSILPQKDEKHALEMVSRKEADTALVMGFDKLGLPIRPAASGSSARARLIHYRTVE